MAASLTPGGVEGGRLSAAHWRGPTAVVRPCTVRSSLVHLDDARVPQSAGAQPFAMPAHRSRLGQPDHPVSLDAALASVRAAPVTWSGCPSLAAAGRGTASPTASPGVLGLPSARRRTASCRLLPCGSPSVKLVVGRWGGRALDGCGWTPCPVPSTAPGARSARPLHRPRGSASAAVLLRRRWDGDAGRSRSSRQCQGLRPPLHPVPAGCGLLVGTARRAIPAHWSLATNSERRR